MDGLWYWVLRAVAAGAIRLSAIASTVGAIKDIVRQDAVEAPKHKATERQIKNIQRQTKVGKTIGSGRNVIDVAKILKQA